MAGNAKKDQTYQTAIFGLRSILRILLFILLAVGMIYVAGRSYYFGYEIFNEQPASEGPGLNVEVNIPEEASVREIAHILKDNGLIRDVYVFIAQERLSAYHGRLRGGSYVLNTTMLPTQIFERLAAPEEPES